MSRRAMRRGFTIVELLVTIGIIALLMGLLMGGISRARGAARASREASDLRQLHVAWTMYADQFASSCLPGHMSVGVQEYWKLKYRSKSKVEGQASDKLPREVTTTYPWRLMPYMDYSWDVMMDYRPADGSDPGFELTAPPLGLLPGASAPDLVSDLANAAPATPGVAVALQPAFGYNAYYVGGVWRMPAVAGSPPQLVFGDAKPTPTVATAMNISQSASLSVVVRKVGGARFPDLLTLFCPSAYMGPSKTAVGETLLELPAGTLDRVESLEAAAARELAEETGYRAGRIEAAGSFWMSPGILRERMHLFVADRLVPGPQALEPGERIRVRVERFETALAMCLDGTIADAKTIAGLMVVAARRRGG